MTTTETSDGESAERNASRRHQNERTSPSAEGTDFQMVTFKEDGTISKQYNLSKHTVPSLHISNMNEEY